MEYEGELKGADNVSQREIIHAAIARALMMALLPSSNNMNQIVQWFDLGGEIQMRDSAGTRRRCCTSCAASRPARKLSA